VSPEEFVSQWRANGHHAEVISPADVRVVLKSGWALRFSTNVTKDPRLWSLVGIHHRSTADTDTARIWWTPRSTSSSPGSRRSGSGPPPVLVAVR
jgi:hypothetical protein